MVDVCAQELEPSWSAHITVYRESLRDHSVSLRPPPTSPGIRSTSASDSRTPDNGRGTYISLFRTKMSILKSRPPPIWLKRSKLHSESVGTFSDADKKAQIPDF